MSSLRGIAAAALALLAAACSSGSSPTEPPPPAPPGAVRYSGTIEIVAVDGTGSSSSVRQSCGLSRTRGLIGQEFDFTVSFGDFPELSPPGGRWGSELYGPGPFGCRMSYVRGGGLTQLTGLFSSCSALLPSLSEVQIQTCNGSYGVRLQPSRIELPGSRTAPLRSVPSPGAPMP